MPKILDQTFTQKHLSFANTVHLGSYYTPAFIVDALYGLLSKHVKKLNDYKIIDSSCGYGSFFVDDIVSPKNYIGIDIDKHAILQARLQNSKIKLYQQNSLYKVTRQTYHLKADDNIIMVGNPPYNDSTSLAKKKLKQATTIASQNNQNNQNNIDPALSCRDLGISFLRSYHQLNANYVCVLHPLSYLIKQNNFKQLADFKNNYRLIDGLMVSSSVFDKSSKLVPFPIVIALYEKNKLGMQYDFIANHSFNTIEGKRFCLNDFNYISHYVDKYPNASKIATEDVVAYFWPMRDINALKRNCSFVAHSNIKPSTNAVAIVQEKLPYYCYIDVFKQRLKHVPYYLGNCDVIIDHQAFMAMKTIFMQAIFSRLRLRVGEPLREILVKILQEKKAIDEKKIELKINRYFKQLLGSHYID